MLKLMKRFLQRVIIRYCPFFIIIFLSLTLFVQNYLSGTYVVGWDNNFPEFHFFLNIIRALTSVWQEYRGLGLEDGMSHAANVVHYVYIFLLSLFFPHHLLRYVFIFSMHAFGGIGVYILFSFLFRNHPQKEFVRSVGALSALVYQYNFATVQMFYLPFEPFIAYFGWLPWLLFGLALLLDRISVKRSFFFLLISFLATPMAHVPTVFIVYTMFVFVFLFHHISAKRSPKPVFVSIFLICFANAFWGLPYIASTIHNAHIIANSKNNQRASHEIYLKNHEYGDVRSFALLKSFSLEFVQLDHTTGVVDYMMKPWREHLSQIWYEPIGWMVFGIVIVGIGSVVIKRQSSGVPLVLWFFISLFVIGNNIPLIEQANTAIRSLFPLVHIIFRFVYTKFFISYSLVFSLLFGIGLLFFFQFIEKRKLIVVAAHVVVSVLLFLLTLPSFQGHFLHSNLRVAIPREYFDMFRFFQEQRYDQRIAVFPAPWYWAWTQYRWGVIGSGFQWFGIPQPIMDRAFDPWSYHNENFYWESTQALAEGSIDRFHGVLRKYAIDWLLIDTNIVLHDKESGSFTLEKLLNGDVKDDRFEKQSVFGSIHIYRIVRPERANQHVSFVTSLPEVQPKAITMDIDKAFEMIGPYKTSTGYPDIYFPFRSLFTGKMIQDRMITIQEYDQGYEFSASLSKDIRGVMTIPPFDHDSLLTIDDDRITYRSFPRIVYGEKVIDLSFDTATKGATMLIDGLSDRIVVHVPKVYGLYSYNSDAWNNFIREPKTCDAFNDGVKMQEVRKEKQRNVLTLTSLHSSNCIDFFLPFLLQRQGYVVTVDSKHIENLPLIISITNHQTKRLLYDTYLEPQSAKDIFTNHFVIPPQEPYSFGYTINFDNLSIGNEQTRNELHRVVVHQIPYLWMMGLMVQKEEKREFVPHTFVAPDVFHPYPTYYVVSLVPQEEKGILALYQSFHSGWKAYEIDSSLGRMIPFLFGKPLRNHVLVNNWANGWEFSPSSKQRTIILFFLPQLLQWIGFGLLPVSLFFILFVRE